MASSPSTTIPLATFAKLSPHPLLLATLSSQDGSSPPIRSNGRAPAEPRPVHVHTQSLSHAQGSAVVRAGDTTVICGVRGEVLPVAYIPHYRPRNHYAGGAEATKTAADRRELKDYDLLVPNVELATGCAPQLLPGVPPTALAQTLSTRVYSLLHRCAVVNAADLRIWHMTEHDSGDEMEQDDAGDKDERLELVAYWVLYIDLLFVSYDGNPLDAAWAAVLAALRSAKLPVTRWDPDREGVICSRTQTRSLGVSGLPIACTLMVFLEKERGRGGLKGHAKHWMLLDPDRREECLCREVVTVVVDRSSGETRLRALDKQGGTVVGPGMMKGIVGLAERRWEDFRKAIE